MFAANADGMLRIIFWATEVIVFADDLLPYPDSFMCGMSSDDIMAIRKLFICNMSVVASQEAHGALIRGGGASPLGQASTT